MLNRSSWLYNNMAGFSSCTVVIVSVRMLVPELSIQIDTDKFIEVSCTYYETFIFVFSSTFYQRRLCCQSLYPKEPHSVLNCFPYLYSNVVTFFWKQHSPSRFLSKILKTHDLPIWLFFVSAALMKMPCAAWNVL